MAGGVTDCPMCDVISSTDTASLVYADTDVAAFPPVRLETPVHLLVVTVRHFESLPEMLESRPGLAGLATQAAARPAAARGLVDSGYRLVWNHGQATRQRIGHPQLHLLAARFSVPASGSARRGR